ncbi:DH domain-containing protein [Aphelenchoides bicaudatus]|nr:DH domain-containing protein [Aphelenchoides bicaudatus]
MLKPRNGSLKLKQPKRDAIKEDFKISIRRGLQLLHQVRQLEQKPDSEQLSPTRLHNVTAIERMLLQLEDTERSFDQFWGKHQQRLENCLRLRRFEEAFRKLQSNFAKHMIYLEEHRDVGDGVERARQLATDHEEYAETAMSDVQDARDLNSVGEELMTNEQDVQDRRAQVLRLSVNMHKQISEATGWCRRGVDILSSIPLDIGAIQATSTTNQLDKFLSEGSELQLDAFNQVQPNMSNLILLTTTETSSLLAQVAERIDDIRRLGESRRDALQKLAERESNKPVQIVSPEKTNKHRHLAHSKRQIEVLHDYHQRDFSPVANSAQHLPEVGSPTQALAAMELAAQQPLMHHSKSVDYHCSSVPGTSKLGYVIDELVSTEHKYVRELESIIDHYVKPFECPDNAAHIPPGLRGQSEMIFGNVRDFGSPVELCHILINYRNRFLALYRPYCQNKPVSESLRRDCNADGCRFFVECQRRAGHQLPLSAYLLKPIQRITKYQLLLKELLRFCTEDSQAEEMRLDVQAALSTMMDLVAQINADMQQLHILGYGGDLRLLGALRLQTECEVFTFKRKTRRMNNKSQKRHLFLFDGGILFCKKRTQPIPYSPEFYEHKFCIPVASLGFAECSKQAPDRFELWAEDKSDGYAIYTTDEISRAKWIQRLARLTVLNAQKPNVQSPTKASTKEQGHSSRPHSWTSDSTTASSRSSHSNFDESHAPVEGRFSHDSNGNPPAENESTCTSISSSSRRSSSSHTASDHDNNTSTTMNTPNSCVQIFAEHCCLCKRTYPRDRCRFRSLRDTIISLNRFCLFSTNISFFIQLKPSTPYCRPYIPFIQS